MVKFLAKLRELQHGWDSYDGIPPTVAALSTADSVEYVPLPNGGVQIEIQGGGHLIEVVISPDGEVTQISTAFASTTEGSES